MNLSQRVRQVSRRTEFTEQVTKANNIDSIVATQAEKYLQARVYGVGSANFEMDLLRVCLNERRRRIIAETASESPSHPR